MGARNDWRVEVECLLLEYGITPRPFSLPALACLPAVPVSRDPISGGKGWVDSQYAIPDTFLVGRKDLRKNRFVFSVDPPGCQDIDDAMSLEWLSPGLIEVGVHIADVCAYVEQGSALDEEAKARGTTVYLVHERHDMLPSLISSDIASLHGQKDRLSVSVLWNIGVHHADGSSILESEDLMRLDEANNLNFTMPELPTWTGRAVIHSSAASTYRQAHNIIYDFPADPADALVPPGQAGGVINKAFRPRLHRDLRCLTAFGRFLRRRRQANGALDLSQASGAELKFAIDAEGNPVEVSGKQEMEVHHTISELMIAANAGVAGIIFDRVPLQTLLRIHPPPSEEKLKLLQAEIAETGMNIFHAKASSAEMRKQLRQYRENVARTADSSVVDLLTTSIIRAMTEAKYVCSGCLTGELTTSEMTESAADGRYLGHFGLGLRLYTHFTSPIRRYADIIVHRQLLRVLDTSSEQSLPVSIPLTTLESSVSSPIMMENPYSSSNELEFLDGLLEGVGDELIVSKINPTESAVIPDPEENLSSPTLLEESEVVFNSSKEVVPYNSGELELIAKHLNDMNRRSKLCQMACQKLFLCLYFASRSELHQGIIAGIRENGFM